jgi:hypothetical protein
VKEHFAGVSSEEIEREAVKPHAKCAASELPRGRHRVETHRHRRQHAGVGEHRRMIVRF